ncbi:unnamed protein product [Lupinus luteus]|uniref:Uncharacterized protein n=1 Tax=Lupinus luteus TaxID=3873 RepID=A0AAV1XKQ2_LUPLU
MGEWRYGVWCWSLEWQRNLFDWEQKDVDDLMRCLAEVNLVQDSIDGWLWVHDKGGAYSVKNAYKVLMNELSATNGTEELVANEKQSRLSQLVQIESSH